MHLLIPIGGWVGIGVGALVVIILVIWGIATYNKIVSRTTDCDDGFATIDVYLKKRYDLIPNIVETVKGYAKHESETFIKVTEARSMAASASTPAEKAAADVQMTQAIRNFNMVMEAYPELKANTSFLDLQHQLKAIEGELSQSRKYYNATVKVFNVKLGSFPSSIVGRRMRLTKKPFFEVAAPEERENVKVQF